MKITIYRILDKLESFWNLSRKASKEKERWGEDWRNKTRSGRRHTRVWFVDSPSRDSEGFYTLRPEPGWEWCCPNCKTYSIVTESMMPQVLSEWEYLAQSCKARGLPIPRKPTVATAGCTNCKYRPGAPE
jgi:hypothetical protein